MQRRLKNTPIVVSPHTPAANWRSLL